MNTAIAAFWRGNKGDEKSGHIYDDVLLNCPHWIGNPTAAGCEIMIRFNVADRSTWLCLFRAINPKLQRTSAPNDPDKFFDAASRIQEFTAAEAAEWFKRNGRELPDKYFDARPDPAGPKILTVAEIVELRDVSEPTVTRWAKATNQPKPKNRYAIPESTVPAEWPPRTTPRLKRAKLATAVKWECANCEGEVTSNIKPAKCSKCGRSAFTRKSLKPAAK